MKREKKIAIAVAAGIIIITIAAISLVSRVVVDVKTSDSQADMSSEQTEEALVDPIPEATVPIETDESVGEDAEPVDDAIFEEPTVFTLDGITGTSDITDSKKLAIRFDGLTIKPGMKVRDILDKSDWYSLRENAIVQPDDAEYLILNNNAWTNSDLKLNNDANARNGEIILWAHNYSDSPAPMRDCVVYKYKINYKDCFDVYKSQPQLNYLNKYHLGYKASYTDADQSERVADDGDVYVREIYGNISECQVILDHNDRDGLFAITVSCNEFYGPLFDLESGDFIG